MWRRLVNTLFILTLAALVCAPVAQMVRRVVKVQSLEERRELHRVDGLWPRLMRLDASLAADINNWFNDHYGFRDLLIRAKNELDYQVFRTSDKVLIGDDGWLFESDYYESLRRNDARAAAPLVQGVKDFNDCLMKRGIRLVVLYNVSKSTMYPEHLPSFKARAPREGLAQKVAAALEQDHDLIFVNGERILRPHKGETVFYRTDLHMNMRGAQLVYGELVARMAAALGMDPPPTPHLERVVYPLSGGGERFLGKFRPLGEIVDEPRETGKAFKDDADGRWIVNISRPHEFGESASVFDFVFINLRKNVPLLPTTVLLGSSSTDRFFGLGLNEAFQAIYRTKNGIVQRVPPVIENLPAGTKF
ncbi:MAG TPA: hypothetical protein VEK73_21705, partial [Xanthobacteraceae bacterium]|nr:hypothetical protein [Xanthobacteraceae bacterium]